MDVSAKYALVECIFEERRDLEVISAEWILDNYQQDGFNFDSETHINWPADNPKVASKTIPGIILLINRKLTTNLLLCIACN